MLPTLHPGDEVIVDKRAYSHKPPQTNDIVAVQSPQDHRILIKRIKKIVNNKYFVMGDNENASTDSRKFGMLEKGSILGKVVYTKGNLCLKQ